MAKRSLLCIEPDAATVEEITDSFGAYGFAVESIPNGEQAVEWARTHNPALIILSVEPRKVGYAICNKLKRSPSLREIPLVLISLEETAATFEQHRKLKSRAEEYLLKPLDMADLLAKADRLVGLGDTHAGGEGEDSGEIEIADDEIAEVTLEETALLERNGVSLTSSDSEQLSADEGVTFGGGDRSDDVRGGEARGDSIGIADDTSQGIGPPESSMFEEFPARRTAPFSEPPFEGEQFDQETQDAFAALEAGAADSGGPAAPSSGNGPAGMGTASRGIAKQGIAKQGIDQTASAPMEIDAETSDGTASDLVDLQSLWGEGDLPAKLPWEEPPVEGADMAPVGIVEITDHYLQLGDSAGLAGEADPVAAQVTPPPQSASDVGSGPVEDALLSGLGTDVPPLPEEVLYDDRPSPDTAAKDARIAELLARVEARDVEKAAWESKAAELQARISSLETERQTVRKEQDEQRERMTHAANQGAFSKERDLLGLREIINKKEKDILDLRDALDAKERLILDHKDKIREHERARRDLEERTLGFEKSNVAANEKVSELAQDKEKSVEREKGLKARLDDAHEELRKGQDELEALRKRIAQEIERGRVEVDRTRIELEAKLAEAEESHRNTLSKATEEWAAAELAAKNAHQTELARADAAHRVEIENLQRRLGEEVAAAAERLQSELTKLRRDHEKAIASLKEEQALQLASEREAYESQAETKHRTYRDEVLNLRRRHEEELTAAEDRRQRDILEQEQRRVTELELAENRRRAELQARDEEHHTRVTEMERRHLIEKTEIGDRHRSEHDQAVGRAVRAEGELVARAQEIEQAYRRLASFEADLDVARAELGDRDVKLSQMRDRLAEVEAKAADYEDQIVRAFQRLRSDEKTTEKVRRALAVGLALLDERAASTAAQAQHKSATVTDEAEKS
jgi:DNA-binding response OmpR family regulator